MLHVEEFTGPWEGTELPVYVSSLENKWTDLSWERINPKELWSTPDGAVPRASVGAAEL